MQLQTINTLNTGKLKRVLLKVDSYHDGFWVQVSIIYPSVHFQYTGVSIRAEDPSNYKRMKTSTDTQ